MCAEVLELVPVSQVPPLTDQVNSGVFTVDTLKTLRNLCAKGREIQDMIVANIPLSFFVDNLKTESEFLLVTLQLLNNVCVQNDETQLKLFDPVVATFPGIAWTVETATAAMHFLITCTREDSPFRDRISIELLSPLLSLSDNDNLEFLIITMLPPIANDVVDFALAHESMCFLMLDRLHDSMEEFPEDVNAESFIAKLLALIKQDRLPIPMAKSKIVGVFCAFIGSYEPAKQEAIKQGAIDILLETKKIDVTDPILLEWSVAALRILRGDEISGEE